MSSLGAEKIVFLSSPEDFAVAEEKRLQGRRPSSHYPVNIVKTTLKWGAEVLLQNSQKLQC